VIQTDPAAGARVPRGRTIRLVVSLGKDRVPVPDVTGQSLSDAETVLQGRGLKFDPTPRTKPSRTVRQGYVISTDPGPGALIKRGTQITFITSTGPPVVAVPTVAVGAPYAAAVAALTGAHFGVNRVDEFSDTVRQGGVISVEPSGRATYGSTVTVTVSRGPELVTVPAVTSLEPYSILEQQLQEVGLVPDVRRLLGGVKDLVLRVSPDSGTQRPRGSTVTVWII
jgi:beta-lactam-binding protein with PASTA domain